MIYLFLYIHLPQKKLCLSLFSLLVLARTQATGRHCAEPAGRYWGGIGFVGKKTKLNGTCITNIMCKCGAGGPTPPQSSGFRAGGAYLVVAKKWGGFAKAAAWGGAGGIFAARGLFFGWEGCAGRFIGDLSGDRLSWVVL